MLLYLAGKYSGETEKNIQYASTIAAKLWDEGFAVICPHLNTAHLDLVCKRTKWADFLLGDFEMIARCDAIVMLPNWEESVGARSELEFAKEIGLPHYFYPDLPQISKTETQCPEQRMAFICTIMSLYRLHLAKNADYSPANILATGELGLITRLWDKIARLLSLYGFRFKVEKGEYVGPHQPHNESVDDSLRDSAVYSIIGLLLRQNKWGR